MPNELIEQIAAARQSGSDMRPVIEAWLKTNHKSTDGTFRLYVTVAVAVAVVLAASVIAMLLPGLSDFDSVLQTLTGILAGAAGLSVTQLVRIHHKKHTNFGARLLLAAGGSAQDALRLVFEGKAKGNALADLISAGGEAAS